jgi:hypothetical protein
MGLLLRNRVGPVSVLSVAFANATIFFILSNFGVWLSELNGYAMNLSGLLECYYMGIPFFGNSVAGDVFYASLFFGIYHAFMTAFRVPVTESEEA